MENKNLPLERVQGGGFHQLNRQGRRFPFGFEETNLISGGVLGSSFDECIGRRVGFSMGVEITTLTAMAAWRRGCTIITDRAAGSLWAVQIQASMRDR